jgi:hypothetical protein
LKHFKKGWENRSNNGRDEPNQGTINGRDETNQGTIYVYLEMSQQNPLYTYRILVKSFFFKTRVLDAVPQACKISAAQEGGDWKNEGRGQAR